MLLAILFSEFVLWIRLNYLAAIILGPPYSLFALGASATGV